MDIPFLLADNINVFHKQEVRMDTNNKHQYFLVCFLYMILRCYNSDIRLQRVTIEDFVVERNEFVIGDRSYTPQQVFSSMANNLPSRRFSECYDSEEYAALLQLTIQYAGMYGILTSTEKSGINNKINSEFWNTTAKDLESYKPLYHKQVIDAILSKKPVIVTGGTGTGKTEVIPKLFYYYYRIYTSDEYFISNEYSDDVILAFPRKVLANEKYIGYNASLGYSFNPSISPLMLLAGGERLEGDKPGNPRFLIGTSESLYQYASKCGIAIIDEFHEHDLKSDIFFSLLYKNKKQIVVVTATPSNDDSSLFPKFLPSAVKIHIAGSKSLTIKTLKTSAVRLPPPIDEEEKQEVSKDYRANAEAILLSITPMITYGTAALLFLPKVKDVDESVKSLKSKLLDFTIIPFYSTVAIESSEKIKKVQDSSKLIIVATQAAESSITFPTLIIMIDTGLEIRIITTPTPDFRNYEISSKLQYINKYQALQRKGRVGRTRTGSIILMYDPEKLSIISPNILDGNLTTLVVLMRKFSLTAEDLFVVLTPQRREKLKKVEAMIDQVNVNIELVELRFLKNIFWTESLIYLSNTLIPPEDKELYLQLWEEGTKFNDVYNKIRYQSFVPRRRLIFAFKDNKGLHFVEEKTKIKITVSPNDSIRLGRIFYDQISIFFLIAL